MKRIALLGLTSLAVASLLTTFVAQPAQAVTAGDWRAGRIMDDSIFYNKSSMSIAQIQQFLSAKVPTCDTWGTQSYAGTTRRAYSEARGVTFPLTCLKDYHENTATRENNLEGRAIPAGAKSAANIIWDAAQQYNINPQVIIVLLQKEQGLVLDDWPWPIQYRSATGYGCPDTAACDTQYYGFYNQVQNAARQFRRYASFPNEYNHVAGRNNSIRWSPNGSCGSSTVFIENTATASLYNYTPYQPNQAALNNMNGTGDGCSAYGNRNFWRDFNNWFGTSFGDGFVLAISDDPSDLRQWVLYGTIKQYVPDSQTKTAWNLHNAELVTMSAATLNSISTGPTLDRLARYNNGPIYFMDGGKRYKMPWDSLFDAWNLSGRTISSVSYGLFHLSSDAGDMSFSIKDPNSTDVYMPDGRNGSGQTVLRKYANNTVRLAWEGTNAGYTAVSQDYWDQINDAIGGELTHTKITNSASEWQVTGTYKMALNAQTSGLYPGVAQSVSSATVNRLVHFANATYLIRATGSQTTYLINNGQKYALSSADIFNAWAKGTSVNEVNPNFVSLIPDASPLTSYLTNQGGSYYLVLEGKRFAVPAGLTSAYVNALPSVTMSASLLANIPNGPEVSGFIKGAATPQVYLLDNSGLKRHLEWADKVLSYGGYSSGITTLPETLMSVITAGSSPQIFVTDGTSNFLIDGGKKYTVDAGTQAEWAIPSFQQYTDSTLSRFPNAGALQKAFRVGDAYFVVRDGISHGTGDRGIAEGWGVENAPQYTHGVFNVLPNFMLTRYVRSNVSGDHRVFLVDKGKWYNLPAAQQANLNVSSQPTAYMNPANSPEAIVDWPGVVVKDASNNMFVIDGGHKRYFPHQMIQDQWTNFGQIAIPSVSNGLLQSLPTVGGIERAVKGSGPSVYSVESGTKRHIQYPDTYNRFYAPYINVTDALVNALPSGSPIP